MCYFSTLLSWGWRTNSILTSHLGFYIYGSWFRRGSGVLDKAKCKMSFHSNLLAGAAQALALFVLVNGLAAQDIPAEAREAFHKAQRAAKLADQVAWLERAVEQAPAFPEAVYRLGAAYFQTGRYEQAVPLLERALAIAPEFRRPARLYLRNALTLRATELLEQEEYATARTYARRAVELDSTYASAWAVLGRTFLDEDVPREAVSALRQALALDDSRETVWKALGDAYLQLEDYHLAIQAYERALALDPEFKPAEALLRIARKRNRPEAWLQRYRTTAASGQTEEALAVLQKAHTLFPEHEEIAAAWQAAQPERETGTSQPASDSVAVATGLEAPLDTTAAPTVASEPGVTADQDTPGVAEASPQPLAEASLPASESRSAAVESRAEPPAGAPRAAEGEPEEAHALQASSDSSASAAGATEPEAGPKLAAVGTEGSLTGRAASSPTASASVGRAVPRAYWVVGALLSLLVLGLVLARRRLGQLRLGAREEGTEPAAAAPAETESEPTEDDVFKDEVASVTPVSFDGVETEEMLEPEEEAATRPGEREHDLLKDTQTIVGGIKRVKRIGRYVVEKEIGRGSMGLIYKAWDPKLDRTVVIKQVTFARALSTYELSRLKDRLFNEARLAARLNHENIITIYDVDEEPDFSYIVMEFLEGEDLKTRLERDQRFEWRQALDIAVQVCQALEFAHRHGIVHRDIKPSNILITPAGRVKVADFGIAKLIDYGTLTQTGTIVGTPFYMSPEQIEGRKVDGRSDLFSTGVVLYEMLAGEHPFPGDNLSTVVYKVVHKIPQPPSTLNRALPAAVDAVVQRACAKDPEHRYASAAELKADLLKIERELS